MPKRKLRRKCYNCRKTGHLAKECKAAKTQPQDRGFRKTKQESVRSKYRKIERLIKQIVKIEKKEKQYHYREVEMSSDQVLVGHKQEIRDRSFSDKKVTSLKKVALSSTELNKYKKLMKKVNNSKKQGKEVSEDIKIELAQYERKIEDCSIQLFKEVANSFSKKVELPKEQEMKNKKAMKKVKAACYQTLNVLKGKEPSGKPKLTKEEKEKQWLKELKEKEAIRKQKREAEDQKIKAGLEEKKKKEELELAEKKRKEEERWAKMIKKEEEKILRKVNQRSLEASGASVSNLDILKEEMSEEEMFKVAKKLKEIGNSDEYEEEYKRVLHDLGYTEESFKKAVMKYKSSKSS